MHTDLLQHPKLGVFLWDHGQMGRKPGEIFVVDFSCSKQALKSLLLTLHWLGIPALGFYIHGLYSD